VQAKKTERFKAAKEDYLEFVDNFPQSRYLREAEKMMEGIERQLKSLQSS
jgi:outer membrane protein assembly factor BamD (BamD/ComL family)